MAYLMECFLILTYNPNTLNDKLEHRFQRKFKLNTNNILTRIPIITTNKVMIIKCQADLQGQCVFNRYLIHLNIMDENFKSCAEADSPLAESLEFVFKTCI